ncbi:lysozyme [Sphingomonas sp. M1A8_2b]
MTTSSRAGLGLVKTFEGCKLTAYLCPAGVPTIGYGRTTGVKLGQKITQAQADAWVVEEYDEFEARVRRIVKVPLTANQLGALTSFAYNLGSGALASSTLLRLLNGGDYSGAAAQFARWNKAGGKVLAGLTKRRAAEAALFLKT